jgi:hypothetical protein
VSLLPSHSEIEDYLKSLLEYYDFSTKKEYWISPHDRIDLYAESSSFNLRIGIEVSRTSDIRRDAEKLAKTNFDLVFIIVDNPSYEGKIEIGGRDIPIVYYDNFEGELRKILRISPTAPRFGSLSSWIRKIEMVRKPRTYAEASISEGLLWLESSLEKMGLNQFIYDVKNLLAKLYICKEIVSAYSSGLGYENAIDPKLLNILKNLGLAIEEARGSGELRKYFLHLTNLDRIVARDIILERIDECRAELKT